MCIKDNKIVCKLSTIMFMILLNTLRTKPCLILRILRCFLGDLNHLISCIDFLFDFCVKFWRLIAINTSFFVFFLQFLPVELLKDGFSCIFLAPRLSSRRSMLYESSSPLHFNASWRLPLFIYSTSTVLLHLQSTYPNELEVKLNHLLNSKFSLFAIIWIEKLGLLMCNLLQTIDRFKIEKSGAL